MNKDIQLIQKQLQDMAKHVKKLTNTLGNLEAVVTCDDIGTISSSNEQTEITTQLATFESDRIEEIEYALQKIRNGTYGICEECNKNITITRLQALPTTIYCIKCKSQIEKNANNLNN